jgi:hypothetical protein
LHATVLTNSQSRDDEVTRSLVCEGAANTVWCCAVDDSCLTRFGRANVRLSDFGKLQRAWYDPPLRGDFGTIKAGRIVKLTWLALGEDQAARFRRVEQLTAL